MPNFNQLITFESKNAYDYAYAFEMKKNYSSPKIYTANGDLSKRWYVYFSFRHPETGKLKRVTPIYGIANKFKTKEERLSVLVMYRNKTLELLERGYNPFVANQELYEKEEHEKKLALKDEKESPSKIVSTNSNQRNDVVESNNSVESNERVENANEDVADSMTLVEAMSFSLDLKEKLISKSTYDNYKSRSKRFIQWMRNNYVDCDRVNQLTKKHFVEFLNEILLETSARNRNNYRTDLASLFQTLEDNEVVAVNFLKKIPKLRSKPNRHQRFTPKEQEQIFNYLEKQDATLLLYIKFISYNFLRPIEVNRIKIGDIDLKNKTVQFQAKNSPLKTKIIPDILFKELPDLSSMNSENYLFTPEKIGGEWEASETNRRDHFSKRFKNVVKEHFGFDINHGLYSFRHTFITRLYREIRKKKSPFEAKSDLMLITGHTSMTALEKYLRDIDAELPEDYSDLVK